MESCLCCSYMDGVDMHLEGILMLCPCSKNKSDKFSSRVYGLPSHMFLARFTVPVMGFLQWKRPQIL